MDDNVAVTIWLVSILTVLIGSGFYSIWQGELRTPGLMQQVNDLQHQNAYLQAENTRLSSQSDDPQTSPPVRGWFLRLLWGSESSPNANIVQQQNSVLLLRIGALRQQFYDLQQHNNNLEQQNDKLRNELGNGVASDSHNLDQLRDWSVDRIVELKGDIKERDERLHAFGKENGNFRTENNNLRTTHNSEITRRDERIRYLEKENRILKDTEDGEVSQIALKQLETVLDQTRQSNSDLRAELNTANKEIVRLGDQLKGPEANAKAAAENIAHLEAENKALKIERDTTQIYVNSANENKTNIEHQLEVALAKLKAAEDKKKPIETVDDELKEADKNNAELPARHETSQRHGKAATADIARLASDVQKFTAENTKLTTQLETSEAQLKEAADYVAKLKLQLANCSAAIVKSNATTRSLTDANKANGRLNDDLSEANADIKHLKIRLGLMTTAWEEALSRITHAEEQAKPKDPEQLAQLKADYAKAGAESQEKGHDLKELQTRYDELDEHFAAQIQDLARETAAHRRCSAESQEKGHDLKELQTRYDELDEHFAAQIQDLARESAAHKQCSEEINRLNDFIQVTIKTVDSTPVESTKSLLTQSIISTASTSPIKPRVAKLEFSTLITTGTTPVEPTDLAARVRELESQLQTTTEERDTARKDLRQERSGRSGDAKDCTSEKNQLRTAQETAVAQLQQAQTRVTDLEEELRAAKEERDACASSDAEAKNLKKIADLESNLEYARKELETEREGRTSDNQAYESKKAELEAKTKASPGNTQVFASVANLRGQVKLTKERSRDAKDVGTIKTLEEENKQQKELLLQLRDSYQQSLLQKRWAAEDKAAAESMKNEAQISQETVDARINAVLEKLKAAEEKMKLADEAMKNAKKSAAFEWTLKVSLAEGKKAELEKSVEKLKRERDTLQKQFDTASEGLEKCEEHSRQAALEREAKDKDIERLQAEIQRLEKEAEEVSQRFTDCENNKPAPPVEKKLSFTGFEFKPQDQDENARLKEQLQQAQQNFQEVLDNWSHISAEHDPYPGDKHIPEREGCIRKIQRLEDEISYLGYEEMIREEEIFEIKFEKNQAQETTMEKTMEVERLEMELEQLKSAEVKLKKAVQEIERLSEELRRARLRIPDKPGGKTEEESVRCPKCHLQFPGKSQNWLENEHIPKCNLPNSQDPGSDNESGAHEQSPREEEFPGSESQNKEAPSNGGEPAQQEQPPTGPGTPATTDPTNETTNETTRVPKTTNSQLEQALNVEKLGDVGENQQPSPTPIITQRPIVIKLPVATEEDANANPGSHDLVCKPGCGYRIRALVAESIAEMNSHQQGCPEYQAEVQRAEKEAENNPSGIICDNCNQFWPRDLVSFNDEHAGGRNPCTPDTPHKWQPYVGVNQPPDAGCDLCKENFPSKNRAWLKSEHWPECARKYQEEHGEANKQKRKLGNPVTCDNCGYVYYVGRHTSMNGFHSDHNDQCRKENPRKNGNVRGKPRYEKIKCEHCGTQFSREEMFKDQVGHAYNCPMIPTPTEWKCRHCDAEFTSKDQLVIQHVQAGKCPKRPKKVKCISCREEFAGQTDEWLKTVHLPKCPGRNPQSEDDRTCKNCKYVFLSKNDMFRHLGIGNSEPKQDPQCRKYKHVPPPNSWGARPPSRTLNPTSPGPSQQGASGRKTGPGSSGPPPRPNIGTDRVDGNGNTITPLSGRTSSFTPSSLRSDSGHTTPTQAPDSGRTTPSRHTQKPATYPSGDSSRNETTQNNGSGLSNITPRAGGLAGSDSGPSSIPGVIIPLLNIQQPMTTQKPTGGVQTKEIDSTDLYADPSPSRRTAKLPAATKSQNIPQPASIPTSQPPINIQTSSNSSITNNNAQNTGLAQPKPSSKPTGGLIGNSQHTPSSASRSGTAAQSQVTKNTQQPPITQTDPQTRPPATPSRTSTSNPTIDTQEESTPEPPPTESQTQTLAIGIAPKASTSNISTSAQAQNTLQTSFQPKPAKKTGGLMGKSRWAPDGASAGTNSATPGTSGAQNDTQDENGTGGGQKHRQNSPGSARSVLNTPRPPTTNKTKCTYCDSKNHTEANCGKKESDRKCPYCRQTDHNEVDKCPFKKSDEKKGKLREKCGYCPLWGHTEDVCIKKEKDIAFAARRGGNSQTGNIQTGSGRGRGEGRGRDGNNQTATPPTHGSIASYGSGTANTGTGTAPQTPRAGAATNTQTDARNTQQAGTAQLQLNPKYDAKANRWADMEDES